MAKGKMPPGLAAYHAKRAAGAKKLPKKSKKSPEKGKK